MHKRQEIAELKAERDRLIDDIASLHIAIEVATRRNKGLQADLAATKARNTELEARVVELREEVAAFKYAMDMADDTKPSEPVLPPEPPVGTVVIKTDEQGVPLPGAPAIVRLHSGDWHDGDAHTVYWDYVVSLAPLKIIYSPAEAPEAGEQQ